VASMAWAGAVYKAGHVWRRPSDLGLRWFCGTLFVLALALTLLWDPAYEALDRVVAYPNFAIVAGDGLALAACCGALCYFAHLSYPDARARQLTGVFVLVLVLTLGVMAFFFSRIPMAEDTSRFWEVYAHRPGVAAFRLTFLAYLIGNQLCAVGREALNRGWDADGQVGRLCRHCLYRQRSGEGAGFLPLPGSFTDGRRRRLRRLDHCRCTAAERGPADPTGAGAGLDC